DIFGLACRPSCPVTSARNGAAAQTATRPAKNSQRDKRDISSFWKMSRDKCGHGSTARTRDIGTPSSGRDKGTPPLRVSPLSRCPGERSTVGFRSCPQANNALVLSRRLVPPGGEPDVFLPEHDQLLLFEVEGGAQQGLLLRVLLVGRVFHVEALPPRIGQADFEAFGELSFGGRGHALGGDQLLQEFEGEALNLGELQAGNAVLASDHDARCELVAIGVGA